jgi:hypothetical protein
MPTRKLTKQQRNRYDRALMLCRGGMTALEMMLSEYPPADEATDDGAVSELEDLAARIGELTACWTPAGVEQKYAAGGEGSKTGGDHSHSG